MVNIFLVTDIAECGLNSSRDLIIALIVVKRKSDALISNKKAVLHYRVQLRPPPMIEWADGPGIKFLDRLEQRGLHPQTIPVNQTL